MRRTDQAWLAHERRGSGPPLVLIHGLGSRWQVWQPVLDEVARHRDVIAVDLPGFGASPMWPTPSLAGTAAGLAAVGSVDHLADRVTAFLDGLGLQRPDIAGNSLGGGVALELGRRGLVGSVTAFSPVGFWGGAGRRWCQAVLGGARAASATLRPTLPRVFATRAGRVALCAVFYARPGDLETVECVDSAHALAGAPGFPAAHAALAHWRLGEDPTDPGAGDPGPGGTGRDTPRAVGALAGLPVTVAWGTRDAVLPYRSQARRARLLLPAARHVALPGCGHLPFADDPAACARLLTDRQ